MDFSKFFQLLIFSKIKKNKKIEKNLKILIFF